MDVYGRTALDYAFQIPELRRAISKKTQSYYKRDESSSRKILLKIVRERLSSLSELPSNPTEIERSRRPVQMRTLACALLTLNNDPNHEFAITCFTELGNPSLGSRLIWTCDICQHELVDKPKYVCTQCYNVVLCNACHSEYIQEAHTPRQAPQKLRHLEQLEKDLKPFRSVFFAFSDVLVVPWLDLTMALAPSVVEWLDKRLDVLNNWEEEFNSNKEFNTNAFLKLNR